MLTNLLCGLTAVSALYGIYDVRGFAVGAVICGIHGIILVIECLKDLAS